MSRKLASRIVLAFACASSSSAIFGWLFRQTVVPSCYMGIPVEAARRRGLLP